MPILPGFIQNVALLLVLGIILDLRTRHARHSAPAGVGLGLLLGCVGIFTMLFAVRLEPAIILDARGLLLAISGLFFGPVPTLVAMATMALYRVVAIGGPSTLTGLTFIAGSGLAGLGVRALDRRQGRVRPHWVAFLLLGLAVAALQLGLTWRILADGQQATFWSLAPVLTGVSAVSSLLLGLLLADRLKNAQVATALAERERSHRMLADQLALQSAALNAAVDAIAITDIDGRFLWTNPSFTALTQYSAAEALGRNPRELIKSDRQDSAFYATMWTTLLDGQVWSGEIINRRKDGSEYTEEMTITPVKDAEARITHFVAIKRDITHRKLLEQQLNQSRRIEGIGRLAGGVAHDFNNLLTVVNGTVEIALAREAGNAETAKDLLTIRSAANRGAKLTRQLLAFSRQQVLQPTVLDLNANVTEMHDLLSRVIGERVAMRLELHAGLAHIRADAGQLGQVLMNLVVNARDAMPDGGVIGIRTDNATIDAAGARPLHEMPPGRYVLLSVTDTGTGMDAATAERIFEPFFTTKPAGKGTGLGLPTAYGIVKQSGGFIWVDSALGKGTSVHLAFPAVEAEVVERPSGPSARVEDDDGAPATETVLLVEDEDAIRHVATRVLTMRGYTVIAAASGEEALTMAEGRHIDLLLTDMVMPGMSGPHLAQRLRSLQPGLRVLFASGYSRDAVEQQFSIDDAGFIAKPYGLKALIAAVRERLS